MRPVTTPVETTGQPVIGLAHSRPLWGTLAKSTCADLGRFLSWSVLLSSALLKHFLPDYNSTEMFSVSNACVYEGVVLFELILGLCLLFRVFSGWEAYVAVGTFILFGVLQAIYAITGKHSCSCLGNLSVPPLVMLALDLALTVLLVIYLIVRPPRGSARLLSLLATAALIASLLVIEGVWFGSKEALIASLTGAPYFADPVTVEFGALERESTGTQTLTIRNRTDRVIAIVGLSELPVVRLHEDLPMRIQPGKEASFRVSLTTRGDSGRNVKAVTIFCVDENQLTAINAYLSWVVSEN
jgi:hypothetical protein